MSKVKNDTRFIYMDVIRLVGCFLVICLHMATLDMGPFSADNMEWKVANVMDSVGMTGIAFFFMISGALFLRKESNVSLKYVWKKIAVLFLVYVFCLFFYSALPFLRGWEPWTWNNIRIDIIENVLKGSSMYHLGFPPTLMVLYALSPILKDAFASKKNCEYFFAMFVVFGTMIPFVLRFDFAGKVYLQSFQNRFGLVWLTGHIGYFVLGHYLHSFAKELGRKQTIAAIAVAVAVPVFTMVCNHADAVKNNAFSTIGNTPLSITCFLFVISVYMLIKGAMAEYRSEKGIKVLRYFSSLTFGVYLIHPFVMAHILSAIPLKAFIDNRVVLVTCRMIIVIFISTVITAILKKLPIIRKFI